MFQIEPKESIPITRQIEDPADTNTYYVRAYVRDAKTDELLDTVDLTDKTDQRFRGTVEAPHDPTGNGRYITITTKVFTDAGYTTESGLYGRVEQAFLVQTRYKFGIGGGGGADVSYERIRKVVQEELGKLPKTEIPKQKETDLKPVLKAIDGVKRIVELFEIPEFPKFPDIPKPEKTDLSPVISVINSLKTEVSKLKDTDLSDVEDKLSGLMKAVEDLLNKDFKQDIIFKLVTEKQQEEKPTAEPINFKKYFQK